MGRGKYRDIAKNLPRLELESPSYLEQIAEVQREFLESQETPPTASTLAQEYILLRKIKAELDEKVKKVDLHLEAMSRLLVDKFEAEDITTMGTGDSTVGVYVEPYASVMNADQLREWCKKEGLERSMMLPWQTLNSIAKARLMDGQPEPPGVKIFQRPKIRLEKDRS